MTAVLTFEPLKDNDQQQRFERTDVPLSVQNQVYLVGFKVFKEHPLDASTSGSLPNLASNSDDESDDVTRDGPRSVHEHVRIREVKVGPAPAKKKVHPTSDIGFSEVLVDRKLCVVPVSNKPDKLKDLVVKSSTSMGTMYAAAAIWLAPGYKVMLLPAHDGKVYYQRAIPGNPKWRKIKEGYGVDLADPLMTVLDDAIHIKIDVNPAKRPTSEKLLNKIMRFLYHRHDESRSQQSYHLSESSYHHHHHNYSIAPSFSSNRLLIDGVHTEIEGTKRNDVRRRRSREAFQVVARVSVSWKDHHLDPTLDERLRIEPEKGRFSDLRARGNERKFGKNWKY